MITIATKEYSKVLTDVDKKWFEKIVTETGIIYLGYPVKGVYPYLPYGARLASNIKRLVHNLLEQYGHEPIIFPSLIPLSLFKKEIDFFKGFMPEALLASKKLSGDELDEPLVLRPTSEVPIYYVYSHFISSHKQLPLKVYQTVNVYRIETKATAPLLRLREVFLFNEAHVFCKDAEEAKKLFDEAIRIYKKIYDYLKIPYIVVKSPPWDLFPGAIENYDFVTILPDGKALELASVINLGQKFAKAFKLRYQDVNGEVKEVWQLCYGIGIDRIIASLVWLHGDSRGLVLHPDVAPIQVVAIPIPTNEEMIRKTKEFVSKYIGKFRWCIDEDTERTPGWKYFYWEQKGVPIRLEVGKREINNNTFTVVDRITFQKEVINAENLNSKIEEKIAIIKKLLWERAVKKVKKSLEKKALVLDITLDKNECEGIEEEYDTTTLGVIVDSNFLSSEYYGKILFCKKY